jgi:hypothetical protein
MAIRESIFLDSIPANPTAEIIAILAAITRSSRRDELIRPHPVISNGARDTSGRSPHAVAASSPISRGPGPGPSRAIIARPIDGGLTPFGARLFRERDHDEDECDARHGHSGRGIAGSVERSDHASSPMEDEGADHARSPRNPTRPPDVSGAARGRRGGRSPLDGPGNRPGRTPTSGAGHHPRGASASRPTTPRCSTPGWCGTWNG